MNKPQQGPAAGDSGEKRRANKALPPRVRVDQEYEQGGKRQNVPPLIARERSHEGGDGRARQRFPRARLRIAKKRVGNQHRPQERQRLRQRRARKVEEAWAQQGSGQSHQPRRQVTIDFRPQPEEEITGQRKRRGGNQSPCQAGAPKKIVDGKRGANQVVKRQPDAANFLVARGEGIKDAAGALHVGQPVAIKV